MKNQRMLLENCQREAKLVLEWIDEALKNELFEKQPALSLSIDAALSHLKPLSHHLLAAQICTVRVARAERGEGW